MTEFYARVTIYAPMGEVEFGALDDLVREHGWRHRVEYPFVLNPYSRRFDAVESAAQPTEDWLESMAERLRASGWTAKPPHQQGTSEAK